LLYELQGGSVDVLSGPEWIGETGHWSTEPFLY